MPTENKPTRKLAAIVFAGIDKDRRYNFMIHNTHLEVCYGRLGNVKKAETQIATLSNLEAINEESSSPTQFLSGMNAYCIATVQLARRQGSVSHTSSIIMAHRSQPQRRCQPFGPACCR